jgi:hypothetical protein
MQRFTPETPAIPEIFTNFSDKILNKNAKHPLQEPFGENSSVPLIWRKKCDLENILP